MDTLSVTATLASLKSIADYVVAAAKAAGLDKKAMYRLRLAVDEIATNVIRHGHADTELQGVMTVSHEIGADTLKIVLEDTGRPYDPRQTPPPDDLNRPLEEREVGGLGVYLTLRSVDEFHYDYAENRNKNIFIMHLDKSRVKD